MYGNQGGGTCNFLQTNVTAGSTTLADLVTYSLDAKIGYADTVSGTLGASTAETGIEVAFNAPGTPNYNPSLPTETGFIQYMVTDSRGQPSGLAYKESPGVYIFNANDANNTYLPFLTDTGGLHEISYDVNVAALQLAEFVADDLGVTGTDEGSAIDDLANWSVGGMYVGTEGVVVPIQFDVANISLEVHNDDPFVNSRVSNGGIVFSTSNPRTSGRLGQNISYPDGGPVEINSLGDDTIHGGSGPLTVNGEGATLNVIDGQGSVSIVGGAAVSLSGEAGLFQGNVTVAGSGSDHISQDAESVVVFNSNSVFFQGGTGTSTVIGTAAANESIQFVGGTGAATVHGGGGEESITATGGTLYDTGGSGAQTITGGASSTTCVGGSGSIKVSGATALEFVGGSGVATISAAAGLGETLSFVGGTGRATVFGGAGNETLLGGSGQFQDYGGSGSQVVTSGTGQGIVICGSGGETINNNNHGSLTVFGGSGHLTINGGFGAITVIGGTGQETLNLANSQATVYLGTAAGSYYTGVSDYNVLVAGAADQAVFATRGGDTVAGSAAGSDWVVGADYSGETLRVNQGSHDTVYSGSGSNLIEVSSGSDGVWTGSGDNAVFSSTTGSLNCCNGSGATTWLFADHLSGDATISNFVAGTDSLSILGGGCAQDISVSDGSTYIHLDSGGVIDLVGVTDTGAHGSIIFGNI